MIQTKEQFKKKNQVIIITHSNRHRCPHCSLPYTNQVCHCTEKPRQNDPLSMLA
jgi:hypothetical protein